MCGEVQAPRLVISGRSARLAGELLHEERACEGAPREIGVGEQLVGRRLEHLEIRGSVDDGLEPGDELLPPRRRVEVVRERHDRTAVQLEIAVRIAAGREQQHRPPARAAQLVVRDLHVDAGQEGHGHARLPIVAEGGFHVLEDVVIGLGHVMNGAERIRLRPILTTQAAAVRPIRSLPYT